MAAMQTDFIPLPNIKLDLKMITSDLTICPPNLFLNLWSFHRRLSTNTPRAPSTQRDLGPAGKVCTKDKHCHRRMDPVTLSTHAVEITRTEPFWHQLPCLGIVGPRVPGAGLHVMLGGGYIVQRNHLRKDTWKADLGQIRRLSRRYKRSSSVPDGWPFDCNTRLHSLQSYS